MPGRLPVIAASLLVMCGISAAHADHIGGGLIADVANVVGAGGIMADAGCGCGGETVRRHAHHHRHHHRHGRSDYAVVDPIYVVDQGPAYYPPVVPRGYVDKGDIFYGTVDFGDRGFYRRHRQGSRHHKSHRRVSVRGAESAGGELPTITYGTPPRPEGAARRYDDEPYRYYGGSPAYEPYGPYGYEPYGPLGWTTYGRRQHRHSRHGTHHRQMHGAHHTPRGFQHFRGRTGGGGRGMRGGGGGGRR